MKGGKSGAAPWDVFVRQLKDHVAAEAREGLSAPDEVGLFGTPVAVVLGRDP